MVAVSIDWVVAGWWRGGGGVSIGWVVAVSIDWVVAGLVLLGSIGWVVAVSIDWVGAVSIDWVGAVSIDWVVTGWWRLA